VISQETTTIIKIFIAIRSSEPQDFIMIVPLIFSLLLSDVSYTSVDDGFVYANTLLPTGRFLQVGNMPSCRFDLTDHQAFLSREDHSRCLLKQNGIYTDVYLTLEDNDGTVIHKALHRNNIQIKGEPISVKKSLF
tara:strand:+ start:14130 stop:14534 length:405 start_codon:yes stop_codon:yes gene_type:complete